MITVTWVKEEAGGAVGEEAHEGGGGPGGGPRGGRREEAPTTDLLSLLSATQDLSFLKHSAIFLT